MTRALLVTLFAACTATGEPLPLVPTTEGEQALEAFRHELSLYPRVALFELRDGETRTLGKTTVVSADKVVFGEGSRLVFSNVDAEYWVVVAEEIVFSGPTYAATIMRSEKIEAKKRAPRAHRTTPPRRPRRAGHGRDGRPGRDGKTGRHGATGDTIDLPPVWIIAKKITLEDGETSDHIDLTLRFNGIRGGRGGDGGNGQPGGKGGDGGRGRSDWHECRKRAGCGGRGGDGGAGGRGGDGGRGGQGADVNYWGPREVVDELRHANVKNRGGKGGKGGRGGLSGRDGANGAEGTRPKWCKLSACADIEDLSGPKRAPSGRDRSKQYGPDGKTSWLLPLQPGDP